MNAQPGARASIRPGRDGSAMTLAVVVVVLLSVLGVGLLRLAEQNGEETAGMLSAYQAFWAAEAGLEQALAVAERNRAFKDDARLPFDGYPSQWSDTTDRCSYQVDVTTLGANPYNYEIHSEAVSDGGVTKVVQVVLSQAAAISMGIFGNDALELKSNGHIDSSSGSNPGTGEGQASVGSNGEIDMSANSDFDLNGDILLGANPDGTQEATLDCTGTNCDEYENGAQQVGHVDPDPLGILGPSELYDDFTAARTMNHNYDAGVTNSTGAPLIENNKLELKGNGQVFEMPGGTYYLTEGKIGNHVTLNATGKVKIYLEGAFEADSGCTINVHQDRPENFMIFSNVQDEDDTISMQPKNDFVGFIYAPYTAVMLKPGDDFFGAVWADDVYIWPGGDIVVDIDLLGFGMFDAYRLEVSQWREIPKG